MIFPVIGSSCLGMGCCSKNLGGLPRETTLAEELDGYGINFKLGGRKITDYSLVMGKLLPNFLGLLKLQDLSKKYYLAYRVPLLVKLQGEAHFKLDTIKSKAHHSQE
ncbi:hypothetical protein [Candidatus Methylacidiphilum infernorum]|uniref:Uncharacterized protein n=1 Tax=Methylacidiphilum infernorum (isolate V4) TaxID=481448 RepID=B3DVK0_METI4|nr:hypothetical protein [Candidatus Methylacidiphilum infernorum]ACD83353.1 Hypothetical protein Minf_1299 [Methylacidiphilum infernorum V4]